MFPQAVPPISGSAPNHKQRSTSLPPRKVSQGVAGSKAGTSPLSADLKRTVEALEQEGSEKDSSEPCCKCGPKNQCKYRQCACVAASSDERKVYCTNCKANCANREKVSSNSQVVRSGPTVPEIEEKEQKDSVPKNEDSVIRTCLSKLQKAVTEAQAEIKRLSKVTKEQNELVTLLGQRLKEEAAARQSMEEKAQQALLDKKLESEKMQEQVKLLVEERLQLAVKQEREGLQERIKLMVEERLQQVVTESDRLRERIKLLEAEKVASEEKGSLTLRKRGRDLEESEEEHEESKKQRRESQSDQQHQPMEITPPDSERKADANSREAHQEEKEVKDQPNTNQWEEKRKRTLILKGISNPDYNKVVEVVEKYNLAKRSDVVKVHSRKVQGKDWAFITMTSEEVVQSAVRISFKLKGTTLYIQKDLSKEAREKLKEERQRARRDVDSLLHPDQLKQVQRPVPSPPPVTNKPISQYPNVRSVGVPPPRHFNFTGQMPYGLVHPPQNPTWVQNPAVSYWPVQPSFVPEARTFRWV